MNQNISCDLHSRPEFPPSSTSRSSLSSSHSATMWVLRSIVLPHRQSVYLLPSPLDYWYTSFFFLAGPGPHPRSQFHIFHRVLLAMQLCFHPYPLSKPPPISSDVLYCRLGVRPPLFPLFLSCPLLLFFTPHFQRWTVFRLLFLLFRSTLS